MAPPKKPTHRIIKPSLYWAIGEGGKLKEVEVGTLVTLNQGQAENLERRGFAEPIKKGKVIDATTADDAEDTDTEEKDAAA